MIVEDNAFLDQDSLGLDIHVIGCSFPGLGCSFPGLQDDSFMVWGDTSRDRMMNKYRARSTALKKKSSNLN